MNWKKWLIIIALMLGAYLLLRPKATGFEAMASGAPFYMGYNQPIRNQDGNGGVGGNPHPFDRNARPCVGCNPAGSEIMAGKVKTANELVEKKEKQLNEFVIVVNDYVGAVFDNINKGEF